MENFFAELLGPDSLYILLVSLVSFLIGFLTAWILWRGRAKRYERESAEWKKKHDDLLVQFNETKEKLELKEADLVKAQRESVEAKTKFKALERDKAKWQSDLDAALEESVKAQANASSYQATIEDLNSQMVGLKSMNADLNNSMVAGSSAAADANKELENAQSQIKDLEAKLATLETEKAALEASASDGAELIALQASYEEANKRIKGLEARTAELQSENDGLQTKIEENAGFIASQGVPVIAPLVADTEPTEEIYAPAPEKADIDKGESLTLNAVAARDDIKSAIGTTLPAGTEADKDDLTRITGIGSFLEKKLNDTGIYTYEQISQLDAGMIEKLTTAIEFFPGRIEKDNWVGQAKELLNAEPVAAAASVIKKNGNLRIVEGIGPKIEMLLKSNSIPDLETLSTATEKRLREILFGAGSRYRMHDPTTWPQQAGLAVQGKMEELKELQDRLKGGRDVG